MTFNVDAATPSGHFCPQSLSQSGLQGFISLLVMKEVYCIAAYGVDSGIADRNALKGCATAKYRDEQTSTNYTTLADFNTQLGGTNYEHSTSTINLTNVTDPNSTWSNNDYSLANTSSADIKTGACC